VTRVRSGRGESQSGNADCTSGLCPPLRHREPNEFRWHCTAVIGPHRRRLRANRRDGLRTGHQGHEQDGGRDEVCSRKPGREPDQCRPEAAVDVGDLPLHQLADQDVRAFADRLRRAIDLPTLRVAPPAASNPLASNCLREVSDGAAGSLEYDSMLLHEGAGFLRTHRLPPIGLTGSFSFPAPTRPTAVESRRLLQHAVSGQACAEVDEDETEGLTIGVRQSLDTLPDSLHELA